VYQDVDMWRTDVYKQLEYIRSKYGGSKQYIARSEEEIDFGRCQRTRELIVRRR